MESIRTRMIEWFKEQNLRSLGALGVGSASLLIALGGSLVLLFARGLIPFESVQSTIQSSTQGALLWTGLTLALVAVGTGVAIYKSMPTKPAREAAIAGAVLGLQTIIFASIYLWFRSGDTEIFVRNFFKFDEVSPYLGEFVRGAKNTIVLAFVGEALGIFIGLFLSLLILSSRVVVRAPARVYINFFRGTPLLWQLTFGFFGIVLGLRLELSAYQIAALILGLNAGAYTAEVFRAGIQSIERGQMEAARSLGMSYMQAMRYVLLPQAVRRVIPPLTNEFVILIKDTSLVAVLGLFEHERELLKVGRDAYKTSFNATPLLATAAGYLAVTLPLIRAVTWIERKLRSGLTGVVGQ